MPFTTPITWGTATVTVAQMNEQVRDNMTFLYQQSPYSYPAQGRMTLASGTPVPIADSDSAETIYYTPYYGDRIALYDGSDTWDIVSFTEMSVDVTALTASKPHDFFVYNNGGTATAEVLEWTDANNRATGLSYQNGVLVKTGATTRRFVGVFYVDSGTACHDSATKRLCVNYYNTIQRNLFVTETTSHTYNGAFRKWNNSDTNNKLEFMSPLQETLMEGVLAANIKAGAAGNFAQVRLYYNDSTGGITLKNYNAQFILSQIMDLKANSLLLGYNYVQCHEYGNHAASTFAAMYMSGYIWG